MRGSSVLRVVLVADLVAILFLAGGVTHLFAFAAYALLFLAPLVVLIASLPGMRALESDLRLVAACAVAIVVATPWYFARELVGASTVVDAISCALLVVAAFVVRRRDPWPLPHISPLVSSLPLIFAIVWLGYRVESGDVVRFYGLFTVDFGNLVAVITSLRASNGLPVSWVAGNGVLSYHWLYFTIPATLADFLGDSIPSANALVLVNLITAALLVQTLHTVVRKVDEKRATLVTAIVLFAPLTTYFYQAIAARVPLGPLAMPMRNHLLLSPLASLITFGNNTFALVLALLTLALVEAWNHTLRVANVVLAAAALALIVGYSITLFFPLALALFVWLVTRHVRRPAFSMLMTIAVGLVVASVFQRMHIFGTDTSRKLAFAFDNFAFVKMIALGMVPLWIAAWRPRWSIYALVIVCAILVPSFVYVAGSATGQIDFSMKTGSLIAIAFAPLIAAVPLRRIAIVAILVGALQTAVYVFQFPYYVARHATMRSVAIPRDYAAALDWMRTHTAHDAVIVDEQALHITEVSMPLMLAERRVWLPIPTGDAYAAGPADPAIATRLDRWQRFKRGERVAIDADYAVANTALPLPLAHEAGEWRIYRLH